MKKATVVLLSLAIVCILILAGCNDNSTNTSDVTASAKATEKIENTHKPITSADPTGTAQTAEPTNSTVEPTKVPTKEPTKEPTKAPTPTPTAIAQPTADPAIYPDDFGEAGPNNSYRTDGKVFFWTKTRHVIEIPEELQYWVYPSVIDEANEQAVFSTGFLEHGTLTYYAIRDGVFYKLNQGKIVQKHGDGFNAFCWTEEDGTACSIGVRSNWWNEVYIEGTNCKGIFYDFDGSLLLDNKSEGIIKTNEQDVLRETTIVK